MAEKPKVILINNLGYTVYIGIQIIEDGGQRLKITFYRDKNLCLNSYELMHDQELTYQNLPLIEHPGGKLELLYCFEVRFYTGENIFLQPATNEDKDYIFILEQVFN